MAGNVDGELPDVLIADGAGSGDSRAEKCFAASLRKVVEMRTYIVGDRGVGMFCQPSETSCECLGGHSLQIGGRFVPVDASASRCQNGRRFSFAAGEAWTVDAVDDGLFSVGHHDGVAQHVDWAEPEKLALDRIDDTDFRIEYAAVAGTDRRDQPDDLAMLGRKPVVLRGRAVSEVAGVGDPACERQDIAFTEGFRTHFGRNEQVAAPTGALQPTLPAQPTDHMVGGLGADTEHVDDLLALHFPDAVFRHAEDDAAFLG